MANLYWRNEKTNKEGIVIGNTNVAMQTVKNATPVLVRWSECIIDINAKPINTVQVTMNGMNAFSILKYAKTIGVDKKRRTATLRKFLTQKEYKMGEHISNLGSHDSEIDLGNHEKTLKYVSHDRGIDLGSHDKETIYVVVG